MTSWCTYIRHRLKLEFRVGHSNQIQILSTDQNELPFCSYSVFQGNLFFIKNRPSLLKNNHIGSIGSKTTIVGYFSEALTFLAFVGSERSMEVHFSSACL